MKNINWLVVLGTVMLLLTPFYYKFSDYILNDENTSGFSAVVWFGVSVVIICGNWK